MKQIAVLIAGEYREFEIAHQSWSFLKWPNVDLFFSTWSESSGLIPGGIVNQEKITIEKIHNRILTVAYDIADPILTTNNERMINRWQAGLRLIQSHEKKYDVIILIRPDMWIHSDDHLFPFFDELEENALYGHIGNTIIEQTLWLQDWMFAGTSNSMFKLLELPINNLAGAKCIHTWLANCCLGIYNKIERIPITAYSRVVRSTARELSVVNTETIVQTSNDWWYLIHAVPESEIKKFKGYSGSNVSLMRRASKRDILRDDLFVRKKGNVERNFKQMLLLSELGFPVPKILNKVEDTLDMEYIPGSDVGTYLLSNHPNKLIDFIIKTVRQFQKYSTDKNYYSVFSKNIDMFKDDTALPFHCNELIGRLPLDLEQSVCHGDFTLENIICRPDDTFCMIDTVSGEYDSWIFDLAKMRQDLEGHWFLRDTQLPIQIQLLHIRQALQEEFPIAFNDYIYILMLLRVYRHTPPNSQEQQLILKEIIRKWH